MKQTAYIAIGPHERRIYDLQELGGYNPRIKLVWPDRMPIHPLHLETPMGEVDRRIVEYRCYYRMASDHETIYFYCPANDPAPNITELFQSEYDYADAENDW